MTVSIKFIPIKPNLQLNPQTKAQVAQALRSWQGSVLREVSTYPAQMPTNYVRTGHYGQFWAATQVSDGLGVENRISYARWVGGSGEERETEDTQTDEMKRRRWPRLGEVAHRQGKTLEGKLSGILQGGIRRG